MNWWDIVSAPAKAMTAMPPQKNMETLGLLGKIHQAIDPVQAFGGYGNMAAMAIPGGAAKMTRNIPPKVIGTDAAGRPKYDFRGADVYHFTDKDSAANIASGGYKTVGDGYYGDAVSFTHNVEYGRQFAGKSGVQTTASVSKDARILNSAEAADSKIIQSVLNDRTLAPSKGSARPGQKTWSERFKELGYDGLYDPGAGDLFIYNPKKVNYKNSSPLGGK